MIAATPEPPYYAVIFSSVKSPDEEGYAEMATEMNALAARQPGFLGVESARGELGITVSYWDSLEAIKNWKKNIRHLRAQQLGREKWYRQYKTRICKVERDYEF